MKALKLDTSKLFKDGKKFYAIYTGVQEGEALLSGAKQIFQVKPDDLSAIAKLKEGDRVYFDDKGALVSVKEAKPPRETASRTSGTTRKAGDQKTKALLG